MTRLPTPGGDNNDWGAILNDFLSIEHTSTGELKKAADIAEAKSKAASAVQSVNGKSGTSVNLSATDVGAIATNQLGIASGVATLGSDGKIASGQMPLAASTTRSVLFSQAVALPGGSGSYYMPVAGTIRKATLSVIGAPTGSPLTILVLHNSSTVATLTIAAGSTTPVTATLAVALVAGSAVAVNATSIGSTSAATGVVLQLDVEG